MKKLLSAIVLGITLSASASVDTRRLFKEVITTDFGPDDALCFTNDSFKDSAGNNPYLLTLAAVADEKGSCQGMVGVAAAVKTRVQFRPEKPKMSAAKIKRQIRRSVFLHKNNCGGKVVIDGYKSLKELCAANQDNEFALRRRSLQYNLSLAIKEILPESWSFFREETLASNEKLSKHLLETLLSMHKDLKNGEYPLMLVRTHVTVVTGMTVERDEAGFVSGITLRHYDPNVLISSEQDFFERTYTFSKEGFVSGRVIWNISPRATKIGCLFKHTDVE